MASLAFVSSFTSGSRRCDWLRRTSGTTCRRERSHSVAFRGYCPRMLSENSNVDVPRRPAKHRRVIGIIGKPNAATETSVEVDSKPQGGLFGMRANAYWESMGVLPLFFAGFGILALAIKMVKVKGGELRGGSTGVNKVTIPKTAITSEEEEAELHVFKCGGCGYEMYPARGREFKFFPDSFKCPLCGTPKSEFWDLNDPDDPRNQEPEDDGDGQDDGNESRTDGKTTVRMEDAKEGTD